MEVNTATAETTDEDYSDLERVLSLIEKMSPKEERELLTELGFRHQRLELELKFERPMERDDEAIPCIPFDKAFFAFITLPIVFSGLEFLLLQHVPILQVRMDELIGSSLSAFVFLLMTSNILMSFALANIFYRVVDNRLELVRDNLSRFSRGQPLHQPLQGNDPISRLDKSFRQLITTTHKHSHKSASLWCKCDQDQLAGGDYFDQRHEYH